MTSSRVTKPSMVHAEPQGAERGAAVVELPLVLAFMVIPFAFLVLTIPTWLQGMHAANDVAAVAARASVLAGGDPAALERAVRAAEASHGLAPGSLRIESIGRAERGEDIEAVVSVELRGVVYFDLGSFRYTASHSERYPTYVRRPG